MGEQTEQKARRRLCAKAFGLCCGATAVVALVLWAAGAMGPARLAGMAVGLAVCAGAQALFCKAWSAAPNLGAVTVWYVLRVVLVFGAVACAVFIPWLDAVGVLVPQLFGLPALAVLMVLSGV